jgi:DNA-binding protein HU-beta
MKKSELVKAVAEKNGWSQKDAKPRVQAVIDTIKKSLIETGTVQLVGFGKFEVRESAERQGRNPATGEKITIPATNRVKFKVGKSLAESVNN